MADLDWKDRIAKAQDRVETLSTSARDTADAARARIGTTYSNARDRLTGLAQDSRSIAATSAEISGKAIASGRKTVDRAMVQSRDLIAERPIAAVAIGLTAGVVLGYFANRLAQSRRAQSEADDEFTGG
ncbi:MAG: hypothetical protein ABL909_09015 [Sphingopyxis sp.]